MSDQLAVLRNSIPERLVRFAERYMCDLDAPAAAAHVGAPGQAGELMRDRRTLVYLSALAGHIRSTNEELRAHMVGLLTHMALYDPAGAMGAVGWLPFAEWPQELRMCVEGLELYDSGAIKKVKWVKRLDVVQLLLQLTGHVPSAAVAKQPRVVFEAQSE